MNLAGHLGILSAKNSTDQTWAGYPIIGRCVPMRMGLAARRARPHPPQPHLARRAARRRDPLTSEAYLWKRPCCRW